MDPFSPSRCAWSRGRAFTCTSHDKPNKLEDCMLRPCQRISLTQTACFYNTWYNRSLILTFRVSELPSHLIQSALASYKAVLLLDLLAAHAISSSFQPCRHYQPSNRTVRNASSDFMRCPVQNTHAAHRRRPCLVRHPCITVVL